MIKEKKQAQKLALISVISNTLLIILKVFAGLYTNSISILSEAIHSGIDLLAAIMALWAIRAASKPADSQHPYGHGKIENISGTIEAILIFFAAIIIIYEAVKKIITPGELECTEVGIFVMLFSSLVNFIISNRLLEGAKKYDSLALEADGLHLRADVYTSVGVMGGLVIVYFTDCIILDPIVAIITAVIIIKAAWDMTDKSFKDLLDCKLPEKEVELIENIINEHSEEFVNYHKLRTRKSGGERFIDLHLVMDKNITLKEAHDFCDHLEEDINKGLNNCNILIHLEPDTDNSTTDLSETNTFTN